MLSEMMHTNTGPSDGLQIPSSTDTFMALLEGLETALDKSLEILIRVLFGAS